MARKHLLIVQNYIPKYRVEFFKRLRGELEPLEIRLTIATLKDYGEIVGRNDDASDLVTDCFLNFDHLAHRHFRILRTNIRQVVKDVHPSHVILEQALRNVSNLSLILRKGRRTPQNVGLWGHGKLYGRQGKTLTNFSRHLLVANSDWFFVYTEAGALYLHSLGFSTDRITVVANTIDVQELQRLIDKVGIYDLYRMQSDLGLKSDTPTGLFLGSLSEGKGIETLLIALPMIRAAIPNFQFIFAGAGPLSAAVQEFGDKHSWVKAIGRVDGAAKATLLNISSLLMVPSGVGLVAIDSLASGTPICTLRAAFHGPEFDYLSHETTFFSEQSPESFARACTKALQNPDLLNNKSRNCKYRARKHYVEGMATRYASGVRLWMEDPEFSS